MIDRAKVPLKNWLVLVAVFVLGCITGVGLTGVYQSRANVSVRHPRSHDREAMFEKMRRDLNLNEEQSEKMQRVLEETASDFRTLRGELRPKYEELRLKARGRMRALLNTEQQRKFELLMAEIDAGRENGDVRGR
jgi:Spy/CpxP family protein refolding chaperone